MRRYLPWLNIVAALIALGVNGISNALPLNGQNTGEISDRFKVLFVPAGYVFAIWGVIYLGWIAFVVYQALPAHRHNPRLQKMSWLFALSCAANAAWLFCWHYKYFELSVVVMLTLLLTLIAIYVRLDIGRAPVTTAEKWCVNIPFSIYLGWISVATIANITDVLYLWKWNGFGIAPELWAVIMLVVATILGLAMALTCGDVAYLSVLAWSYAGIANKQAGVGLVANSAWLMTALVLLMIPFGWWYRKRRIA